MSPRPPLLWLRTARTAIAGARRWSLLAVLSLAMALGQGLGVSSGIGSPGGSALLTISLTSPAGSAPTGLQWTISYNPADIAAISVAPGPSSVAAAKSVYCSSAVGARTCLAIGMNGTSMANGIVATMNVTLTASAVTTAVRLTNTLAASGSGSPISLSGGNGTITVQSTAGSGTTSGGRPEVVPPRAGQRPVQRAAQRPAQRAVQQPVQRAAQRPPQRPAQQPSTTGSAGGSTTSSTTASTAGVTAVRLALPLRSRRFG